MSIDPVDLLGSYRAPEGWNTAVELTGPDADSGAVSLLERILTGRIQATGPRRRHLRLVTGVVVAVGLGGAAVAATNFWSRSPEQATTLTCWSESVVPPGAQVALGWDGADDPIGLCSDAWNGGDLGADGPPEPLQACVSTEGIAAVVPGDVDTCSTLGLATFSAFDDADPAAAQTLNAADLERELVERYNIGQCAEPADAEADIRQLLTERGLDDWVVVVSGFSGTDTRCASVAVDPQTSTIAIVPA